MSWKDCCTFMNNPKAFVQQLKDLTSLDAKALSYAKKVTTQFNPDELKKVSYAASSVALLCENWVKYYELAAGQDWAAQIEGQPIKSAPIAKVEKREAKSALNLNHTVVIEQCSNCNAYSTHSRLDESKY